jgi:CRISPR-associated protein Cmr1
MDKIILKCEIVTPMFCYGADGKTPELRVPSLKGALRFWWRAIHPNLNLDELKKKETEIFGGSGDNEAKKSSFFLQIISSQFKKEYVNPLPHKTKTFKKDTIPAKTKFEIIIRGENHLKIRNLIEFISIVGGIGGRSRRGFGSFKISAIDGESYNFELTNDELVNLIQKINPKFEFKKYTRDYPYLQKIEIGKAHKSYNRLLKKIGISSHENNSDYTGNAIGGRYASPIYVSIYKHEDKFYPIISTLKRTIPDINGAETRKDNFIKDILEGNND